jgi:hypothetical protein
LLKIDLQVLKLFHFGDLLLTSFVGHPSVPLLPLIGGELIIRTNWLTFLEEFEISMKTAKQCLPLSLGELTMEPIQSIKPAIPLSHFEAKFLKLNETLYELSIKMKENSKEDRQSFLREINSLEGETKGTET